MRTANRRRFSPEFKRKVVEEVKSGLITTAQAMKQYEIGNTVLYQWIRHDDNGNLEKNASPQKFLEQKIAQLERKIGQQAMEIDLLKKAREHFHTQLKEKSLKLIRREQSGRGVPS